MRFPVQRRDDGGGTGRSAGGMGVVSANPRARQAAGSLPQKPKENPATRGLREGWGEHIVKRTQASRLLRSQIRSVTRTPSVSTVVASVTPVLFICLFICLPAVISHATDSKLACIMRLPRPCVWFSVLTAITPPSTHA